MNTLELLKVLMSLEKLKNVTLAKVLDDLGIGTITLCKIGYIVSKLGIDSVSGDPTLFTQIENHFTQISGLKLDKNLMSYGIFRYIAVELLVDLYNSHIQTLHHRLSNIFDDDRLCALVVSIYKMLLLFVTPDKRTLEKVFGESLYYWAKVGAKFGYISNQGYDKFINNFNDFTALIQAIERETGISFDHSQFINKTYRKLFVDTLMDVYNSIQLFGFELLR